MTHALLMLLATALAVVGYIPYIRDTLRGVTRPNRASWLIFAAVGWAGSLSSWAAGARGSLAVPLTYAVLSLIVVGLSIRRGEGGWSRLDRSCLAISALSLVVWWWSGEPLIAVAMNALADAAGTVPTVVKAWRDPARENGRAWLFFCAAAVVDLCLVSEPTLAQLLYPAALALSSLAVVVACHRRRR